MKAETKTCVECGQSFDITEGWHELMKTNPAMQLPKRCHTCRRKKRESNRQEGNRRFKKTLRDSRQ